MGGDSSKSKAQSSLEGVDSEHVKAAQQQQSVLEIILSRNPDVNARDVYGCTPLHIASLYGNVNVVEVLLNRGADVNAQTESGSTALHLACQWGYETLVEMLCVRNADIEVRNEGGKTPLHVAAKYHFLTIVKMLLQRGADLTVEDEWGRIPLDTAMRTMEYRQGAGRRQSMPNESRRGFSVEFPVPYAEEHVTFAALQDSDSPSADQHPSPIVSPTSPLSSPWAFLERKASICSLASLNCLIITPEVKQLLINHEAGVTAGDWETILSLYADRQEQECLLAHLADVNSKGSEGKTPLHLTVGNGNFKATEILVSREADINVEDDEGMTPLHHAALLGYTDSFFLLLNRGADIEKRDVQGRSMLHLAAIRGDGFVSRVSRRDGMKTLHLLTSRPADQASEGRTQRAPIHTILHQRSARYDVAKTMLDDSVENTEDACYYESHCRARLVHFYSFKCRDKMSEVTKGRRHSDTT